MKSRIRLLAGAFLLVACGSRAETLLSAAENTTPEVQFAIDVWPGEGIPVIEAKRAVLPLRAAPDPDSPVVDSIRGRLGQRLTFDSTSYQTIRSGAIRVVTPLVVAGRDLGESTHLTRERYYQGAEKETSIPVVSGGTIEFLQYRAEGTCFVRIDRRVIDAQPCPGFGKESVEVVADPVCRWWIRARGAGGSYGWLLVSDSTAQATRREF